MSEFLIDFVQGYGLGFFYLFTIPAFVVCGILTFEACSALLKEIRQRSASEPGDSPDAMPGFSVEVPDTTLRELHYRPLERFLTQPFAKQVNHMRWFRS